MRARRRPPETKTAPTRRSRRLESCLAKGLFFSWLFSGGGRCCGFRFGGFGGGDGLSGSSGFSRFSAGPCSRVLAGRLFGVLLAAALGFGNCQFLGLDAVARGSLGATGAFAAQVAQIVEFR